MCSLTHICITYLQLDAQYIIPSNANAIALFLETHEGVANVVYPGLISHPQHDIATRQQHGYGAMITFYVLGTREHSGIVLKNVSLLLILLCF